MEPTDDTDVSGTHSINEILHCHNAIKTELSEIAEEARKIQPSGNFTHLSAFNERLQFIAQRTRLYFQQLIKSCFFFHEHAEEESQFNKFRCLIEDIQTAGVNSSSVADFYSKLCSHADQIMESIQRHFNSEEVQVLPLARKHFSYKRPRELLYQSLCAMPLKLIELVLPWLIGSLAKDEAKSYLKNMISAAPTRDSALLTLFSRWACKGRNQDECVPSITIGCCPLQRFSEAENDNVRPLCACACAMSFARNSTPAYQDEVKRPIKRCNLASCDNCASDPTVTRDAPKLCSRGRSCCVPNLGVNGKKMGLSSLPVTKQDVRNEHQQIAQHQYTSQFESNPRA